MKRYSLLAACLAAVLLAACSSESKLPKATGKGDIRAINAIATSPAFSILIEERVIGTATYKSSSDTAPFDDLDYTFNFEAILAGDAQRTRLASQFLDVEADRDYTFVISGSLAAPDITLWESDVPEFSENATTSEIRFGHTAASLGAVDVYLGAAGVAPLLGSQVATLGFLEASAAAEFEADNLVLTVTAAGDPATVLFESDPITFVAQTAVILSLFDADPGDLAPLAVSLIATATGGSAPIADANFPPTVRFFHTSITFDTADIYVDDPLGVPIVTNHAFRDVTGDIPVAVGDLPLTYTTAGNIGSILIDRDLTAVAGRRTQYYVVNNGSGTDALVASVPDRRPVETFGKLGIINTAANHLTVDVYIVNVGEAIDEVAPIIPRLPVGSATVSLPINGGSYDIYVTAPGEKTVISGPTPARLDIANGDIVEAIIYDNVDPAIADVVFVPSP